MLNIEELLSSAVCGECRLPLARHAEDCSTKAEDKYKAAVEVTKCPKCGKDTSRVRFRCSCPID